MWKVGHTYRLMVKYPTPIEGRADQVLIALARVEGVTAPEHKLRVSWMSRVQDGKETYWERVYREFPLGLCYGQERY